MPIREALDSPGVSPRSAQLRLRPAAALAVAEPFDAAGGSLGYATRSPPGGGRKRLTETDPQLFASLEWLVDPITRGDPMSPLRWTCKSTHDLARALTEQGHELSPRTVGWLLNAAGFSLQSNRQTKEGADHPDRNAQVEHINQTVMRFQ